MSDNPFGDCEKPERVLWKFAASPRRNLAEVDALTADALARIGELTPRTVDETARWRAIQALRGCLSTYAPVMANADTPSHVALAEPLGVTVDRIIDALGWTAAEPERDCENCGGRKCMSCCSREMHDDCADDCPMCCPAPVPPAPVVELDADDLSALSDRLREWADLAFNIGVDEDHEIPTGVGRIAYSEATGKWVLRIGGGQ